MPRSGKKHSYHLQFFLVDAQGQETLAAVGKDSGGTTDPLINMHQGIAKLASSSLAANGQGSWLTTAWRNGFL